MGQTIPYKINIMNKLEENLVVKWAREAQKQRDLKTLIESPVGFDIRIRAIIDPIRGKIGENLSKKIIINLTELYQAGFRDGYNQCDRDYNPHTI